MYFEAAAFRAESVYTSRTYSKKLLIIYVKGYRLKMSSVYERRLLDYLGNDNVTMRRTSGPKKGKMTHNLQGDLHGDGSIFIDSILSQDEANDVVSMLIQADEHEGGVCLPSFCTSTQMGGRKPVRPLSPPLSPLGPPAQGRASNCDAEVDIKGNETMNNSSLKEKPTEQDMNARSSTGKLKAEHRFINYREGPGNMPETSDAMLIGEERNVMNDSSKRDPLTDQAKGEAVGIASHWETTMETEMDKLCDEIRDVSCNGDNNNSGDEHGKDRVGSSVKDDDSIASEASISSKEQDPLLLLEGTDDEAEPDEVSKKLGIVNGLISKLDDRATKMSATVAELENSLEFSQHEIEVLKQENKKLKLKLVELDLEDKRTQFQMNSVEDKVDRLETACKKKNLVFEGVPEPQDGRREVVEKTVCNIFDQLSINQSINFEACYRMGPTNKSHPRAIMVTFEKQSERDAVYARRMELKNTTHYKRVWINEDLGSISKRKRNIIRLITKEAQLQGIDCRSGKYSLHMNRTKFDCDNLDDLPPPLHPTQLKQVQIDAETIAYQSEFAPFSNFYPSPITIGSHKFFCLEQAFQFLRAKTLGKPLVAMKIYLSRDVRFIKQLGSEMGTSETWETKQFDVMYECLKRKFTQNPELRSLLLKSGQMMLVEATPDRLWGCGATLSSNVLRRREWSGQNKQGKILMTVREEIRLINKE